MSPEDIERAETIATLLNSAAQTIDHAWNVCDHTLTLDGFLNPLAELQASVSSMRRRFADIAEAEAADAGVNRPTVDG